MEHEFEAQYANLNPEQKRAVDAIDGPVMVIAGPGTGKTKVLTMRIANILKKTDTSPDSVLALTFTESGVATMRKRLADLIGAPAYRVEITTFHGFANQIIKEHPDDFPSIIGATNCTDVDQIKLVVQAIDESEISLLRPFGDRYFYQRAITGGVNELKRQGVGPERFAQMAAKDAADFEMIPDLIYESGAHKGKMKGKYLERKKFIDRNVELAKVYAKYQELLREAKLYDYSDMIMETVAALERNRELLQSLQEEYQYILVDEHQDTNKAQNRIIELLASYDPRPNLFVVGDEKQAIFRFQGASLENFLYFKDKYADVELINLTKNYRSTQTILDAAHALAPEKERLASQRFADDALPAGEKIKLCALSSERIEQFYLGSAIKKLLDQNVPAEEIAVLYRENRDAQPIARALEKFGVPYVIQSDQDLFGDEDIRKLLTIMKALEKYGSGPELVEAMHVDVFGIPPLDAFKVLGFAGRARADIYDVIASRHALEGAGVAAVDAVLKLSRDLAHWKTLAKNADTAVAFETIVRESGILARALNSIAADDKIAKLHAFFDQIKAQVENHKTYTLEDFFKFLAVVREHEVVLKKAASMHIQGRVRLMTAHKSKGLEFERVFLVGAVDGHWGGRRRHEHLRLPDAVFSLSEKAYVDPEEERDEDELNLFYVALTRAKHELTVTYAEFDDEGREELPTKFIGEISAEHVEKIDGKDVRLAYNQSKEFEFMPAQVPADLAEKEYLNQLFKEQGISATALNNYLNCPWKYFYVNLIRIPEAPNKHLMYGTAVHEALRSYFEAFSKGEDRGKDYLLQRFRETLARQPIQERDYRETLEKGERALGGFFEANKGRWTPNALMELPVRGIELEPTAECTMPVLVNGKIDRLEMVDMANNVNVIDFKTGKPKSRNELEGKTKWGTGDYKRQLVFYNMLLNRYQEGKYRMASAEIDFVEPDEKGNFKREIFAIPAEDVRELEARIRAVAAEIVDLKFWDKTCGEKDCAYCALREMTKRADLGGLSKEIKPPVAV